jgi:hypothetical protein
MMKFNKECVKCLMLSEKVSVPCQPKRIMFPKTEQAFKNIVAAGGLHAICRKSPFRELPYKG